MAAPLLFTFLLCSLPFASVGSAVEPRWQLEDTCDESCALSLLQLPARKAVDVSGDPLLQPSQLQETKHDAAAWLRSISDAPEGNKILNRYKSCSLHAYPFVDKAETIIHNASKTHFVHIFKNAGTVISRSLNSSGMFAGYAHPGMMKSVLDEKDQWFTATVVRDPLRRSLDGFHEVWKRVHCAPPVGQCQEDVGKGFKDPRDCDACTENNPKAVSKWIASFKKVLPEIESKVIAGEGLYGHMFPQLSYLTYEDGSKVELDYLGSMDEDLEKEYRFIFNTKDSLVQNVNASAGLEPAGKKMFRIDPHLLQDDLVVEVCKAYYVDYCCFGFEFPGACKKAGFKCFDDARAAALFQKSKGMLTQPLQSNMTGMPTDPQRMQQRQTKPYTPSQPQSTFGQGRAAALHVRSQLFMLFGIYVVSMVFIVGMQLFVMTTALVVVNICKSFTWCASGDNSAKGTGDFQEPLDIPIPSRHFPTDEKQKKPPVPRWSMSYLVCSSSCVCRMMLLWAAVLLHTDWHRKQLAYIFLIDSALGSFVLWTWGRWEDLGHYLTLSSALAASVTLAILDVLFQDPMLFALSVVALINAQYLYLFIHFSSSAPARLPPFEVKQFDPIQSECGWLGEKICNYIRSERLRSSVSSTILMCDCVTTSPLLMLSVATLPHFAIPANCNLTTLICILLVVLNFVMLPSMIVKFIIIKSIVDVLPKRYESSSTYGTGDYEVAELDSDDQAMSNLNATTNRSMWPSITVILPCYMPIEESIIMDVLDWYRKQEKQYPGKLLVMIVWNSTHEHPVITEKLAALSKEWPALSVHRHEMSTSKADNLNMAINLLTTDMTLVNDADTIVSAATMCRAAMHIHMGDYDVAQSCNTHCYNDYSGTPDGKDRGCFCYQPVIAWLDSMSEENLMKSVFRRCPFNGRGGFWRVDALKAVGFDHRILSEDHDSFHRGAAMFGFRGILDINMLCQERLPPTCSAFINQRVRWRTGALQTRRSIPRIFSSPHFTKFEKLIEATVLSEKLLLMEVIPQRALAMLLLVLMRSWLFQMLFVGGNPRPNALLQWHLPHFGLMQIIVPDQMFGSISFNIILACVLFGFLNFMLGSVIDALQLAATRYRPLIGHVLFKCTKQILVDPVMNYVEGKAFHQYIWGNGKFIPTIRKTNQEFSHPGCALKADQKSCDPQVK